MKMNTLYEPSFEHDACGIGAVVNIDGSKSHKIVDNALSIVEKLEHRAGKDASGETGDGVGILVQISHDFFKKAAAELVGSLGEREYGIGQFFFPGNNVVVEPVEGPTEEGEVSPSLQPASRFSATPSAGTPRNAPFSNSLLRI